MGIFKEIKEVDKTIDDLGDDYSTMKSQLTFY